jgi:hypothetical protein
LKSEKENNILYRGYLKILQDFLANSTLFLSFYFFISRIVKAFQQDFRAEKEAELEQSMPPL